MPDVKLTTATEESWGGSGVNLSAGFVMAGAILLAFALLRSLSLLLWLDLTLNSDQGYRPEKADRKATTGRLCSPHCFIKPQTTLLGTYSEAKSPSNTATLPCQPFCSFYFEHNHTPSGKKRVTGV